MKRILLLAFLISSPALAQQQPSTALQRVSVSLGQCVGSVESKVDELTALQRELADAKAEIEKLKAPKADPAPKKDDAPAP
jgi:septal ring factor EnvC (AmiA/AmiB activator)